MLKICVCVCVFQYLLEAGWAAEGKVIGVTQPRRVAATSVCIAIYSCDLIYNRRRGKNTFRAPHMHTNAVQMFPLDLKC